jgi:hypothetical protein
MNDFINEIREQSLDELDAYWSERMCALVSDDRIDDSDALYLEFVVDGEEPEEYIFMEDLSGIC